MDGVTKNNHLVKLFSASEDPHQTEPFDWPQKEECERVCRPYGSTSLRIHKLFSYTSNHNAKYPQTMQKTLY